MGVNHEKAKADLLLWLKTRELTMRDQSAENRRKGRIKHACFCDGMIIAFHKVWQRVLFPDCSLQDGTLDPDVAARAEKEWTEKAEEALRKKGGS